MPQSTEARMEELLCIYSKSSEFSHTCEPKNMTSKPIDEEDEFEEFEEEDWDLQKQVSEHVKEWTSAWEDAEWDDEDPDDSFQQRLREEIKKAIERNTNSKAK